MEEKVLVKSEQYNIKKLFAIILVVGMLIGIVVATATNVPSIVSYRERIAEETETYETYKDSKYGSYHADRALEVIERFEMYLSGARNEMIMWIVGSFLLSAVIGGIVYWWLSSNDLTVTDKRVYGKGAFGKRVDLPLDSVSAVGSKWPKGIAVATSSGKVAFLMVKNRDEIHKCISTLLIERQTKPSGTTTIKQEISQSNADELKKFKELLDAGVITQDEFDAKKKQLLGM